MPMIIAGMGLTKPDAGVMATKPATAPLAAPSVVGLPAQHHSAATHERLAAAAPKLVATNAETARPFAASALPALKPNHRTNINPPPAKFGARWSEGFGS